MNTLGVLIADGSDIFCEVLTQTLGSAYDVRTCQGGNETLELVRSFKPDVLVLDLMLPGMDGISLLQKIAALDKGPKILATTRFVSDYLAAAMEKLNVGYIVHKPCDIQDLAARVADLTMYLRGAPVTRADPRTEVSNQLLSLGVPTKLRGYGCLREAVLLMARDPGQSITKELYPTVADLCGGTAAQVERAIRGAIQAAWENRDEKAWRQYFQPGPDGQISRPTNAAFITCLANRLDLRQSGTSDNMVG